jgi:hypothetical protein
MKKTCYLSPWVLLVVGVMASLPLYAADTPARPGHHYHFDLVKGAGTAVCDAYLKRLNTTDYTSPPYCDRPETTAAAGFSKLIRVPLSAESILVLYPRVSSFMQQRDQGSKEEDERQNTVRKAAGLGPAGPSGETLDTMKGFLRDGLIVWRYDPLVDMDNDGMVDNIVVWQGIGVAGGTGRCGEDSPRGDRLNYSAQVAFVLAASNDRLDIPKTMAIFGHPSGSYRLPDGTIAKMFRPVGMSIGIFRYQALYYFDTFFNSWGDFENQRAESPDMASTLGVFFRQNGKTRQVCEYHMQESIASNGQIVS